MISSHFSIHFLSVLATCSLGMCIVLIKQLNTFLKATQNALKIKFILNASTCTEFRAFPSNPAKEVYNAISYVLPLVCGSLTAQITLGYLHVGLCKVVYGVYGAIFGS